MPDLSSHPCVPICWLVSTFYGLPIYTFVKPEQKAERVLSLLFSGHEDICEPFGDPGVLFMGSFIKGRAPF